MIFAPRADLAHRRAPEWAPGNTRLIAVPLRLKQRAPWASFEFPTDHVAHIAAPFCFECPAACGYVHLADGKPQSVAGWPNSWCP
eukprot:7149149-Alexandrium_andersonii.AAC.1